MKKENVYQVSDEAFREAIKNSHNIHDALKQMGLNARGAAYKTFKQRCKALQIDLSHFAKDKELRKLLLRTELTIIKICSQSISRQETLKKLGLNPHTNANIMWIDKQIKNLNIDITHWLGEAHLRNKTHDWATNKPLSAILVQNSDYLSSASLKKRLLNDGLLQYNCYSCGISEWMGQKLSLQLEHKNGDHTDNRLENLCLLCPNCHSLTDTFAGKNKGKTGSAGGT